MTGRILNIAFFCLLVQSAFAQEYVSTGAFSRMGFGARGMGMGNAVTAVTSGQITGYYNPALPAFAASRVGSAGFGFLSLDRYFNVLSYTQAIKPTGGLSFGIINAGVRHIDGRDGDGNQTEEYATTENQFSLAFSNQITNGVSIGIAAKLYYARLFEEVSSTTVGFDVGFAARITDEVTIGGVIKEIGSKYKWETSTIYGTNGRTSTDKFPTIGRFGVSYTLPDRSGLVSGEFETSGGLYDALKFGAEYNFNEHVTVRAGIDRWSLSSRDTGPKPTFGFTVSNAFEALTPSLTYAFIAEPVAPTGIHIVSLSITF